MSPISAATHSNSHADQVRQRRTQQEQTRMSQINQRTHTPVKSQPVMTRGSAAAVKTSRPVRQNAKSNVRRQYYYSLDASGVEVRLPSIPLVNPGWRMVSGMLVVILLIGIFLMSSSSMFEVSSLNITGLQRLNVTDVETALKLTGTAALDLHPDEIKAQVTALFPELTDVQVHVGLPAKVEISVRERQPIVAWQMPEQTVWVDPEGVVIPVRGEAAGLITLQADGLPELVAPSAAEDSSAASAESTAASMLASLKAPVTTVEGSRMDLNLLAATLNLSTRVPEGTVLAYSTTDGLGWQDTRGWKVYIGNDLGNLETKLTEYEAIVQQLTERGITPVMISVEHLSAPFFRTE
ncbi:cell division septal protein [Longilinea arvoryzae]|uniref:Cell division septal protein n=1 Tax=Longilinea arvoryzae TaxID=360412 RepID=A0A0S7B9S7_9CHLR|nr:FtsQ-type POTRA domain-containing protein [Longilinea arvoryzae]GAP14271.1 cell division septal protein [Longilinea arvoryzae]